MKKKLLIDIVWNAVLAAQIIATIQYTIVQIKMGR